MAPRDGEVEAGGDPHREGTDKERERQTFTRQRPRDRMGRGGEQGLGETEIQNKMKF